MAIAKSTSSNAASRRTNANDSLSIFEMLMLCLRHWQWFVISLAGGYTCIQGVRIPLPYVDEDYEDAMETITVYSWNLYR